MHPLKDDDGIYIVRANRSELMQLHASYDTPLGWIGSSILFQEFELTAASSFPYPYSINMLSLDGQVKPLFESDRVASIALSPDRSALLASDIHVADNATPQKAVDLLALDGRIIRSSGNYSNYTASIWPIAWSPLDYGNQGRVLVAPHDGEPREINKADDTFSAPHVREAAFSPDGKYILLNTYDGLSFFVSILLDTGSGSA